MHSLIGALLILTTPQRHLCRRWCRLLGLNPLVLGVVLKDSSPSPHCTSRHAFLHPVAAKSAPRAGRDDPQPSAGRHDIPTPSARGLVSEFRSLPMTSVGPDVPAPIANLAGFAPSERKSPNVCAAVLAFHAARGSHG